MKMEKKKTKLGQCLFDSWPFNHKGGCCFSLMQQWWTSCLICNLDVHCFEQMYVEAMWTCTAEDYTAYS